MLQGRLIELDHFDILAEWVDERRDTPLRRVREVCEAVRMLVNGIRKAWGLGLAGLRYVQQLSQREMK